MVNQHGGLLVRVSVFAKRLRRRQPRHAAASALGCVQAQFSGQLDLRQRRIRGVAMGHATGQFGCIGHKTLVFVAPDEDGFVWIHGFAWSLAPQCRNLEFFLFIFAPRGHHLGQALLQHIGQRSFVSGLPVGFSQCLHH